MDKLQEFEKTNKYLFHGSMNGEIQEFKPRQAYSGGEADGEPCVAASAFIDPAIFMAVLGSRKLGGWMNGQDGETIYYLLRSELNQAIAENWTGFVYVLNRDQDVFKPYREFEWRAHTNVVSIEKIKVGIDDLPKNIKLLDDYEQYYQMTAKSR